MDEARVHQIIKANNDDLLKKMSDLISSHVSASVKRPADDSVAIIRLRSRGSKQQILVRFLKRKVTKRAVMKKRNEELVQSGIEGS